MMIKFLIERKSWIMLFFSFHVLLWFLAFIDPGLAFESIAYYLFLSLVLFIIFLVIRYHQESKFYQTLENQSDEPDPSELPNARTPFELIVTNHLSGQNERLKTIETKNRIQLDEEKDELLSWIHEVKTPLSAMALMIDRIDDQRIKTDLNLEWLRIHMLLDQKLHKKRMTVIENDLYMDEVNLQSIINQEIRTLQSWCMYKGIGFDIQLEEKVTYADSKWLAFVVRQILSNAIKYSENTDIIIASERADGQVILKNEDDGQGIDAKDLPRIFEKGFTSTSKHRNQASTGMGLYLAKQVTDAMHIQVKVDSKVEEGTTVWLTFPKKNGFLSIMEFR